MGSDTHAVELPKIQAACLAALRMGEASLAQITETTGLSRKSVSVALSALKALGLAQRRPERVWRTTSRGETCLVSAKIREPRRELSPSGRRLLELLERPAQGRTLAKKLGLSRQGALNVVRRLHALGHVKFADPENPTWWVMRADDETPLLTRDEERTLSATPGEYATNARKIQSRAQLSRDRTEAALASLVSAGLVEAAGEFNGAALFRATAAGVEHPQNRPEIRGAERPHLPVYSDRVRAFLSAVEKAGALRIKDLGLALQWNSQATNSLMQYLKRKGLVQKQDDSFEAPYVLTALGSLTLAEMTQPGQMKFGYPAGSVEALNQLGRPSSRRGGISTGRRAKKAKVEKPPRLPVHSERVQAVLAVLAGARALRIREVGDLLRLPPQSINALMQYLKRKALVQKTGERPGDPYALTELGRATLTEMRQRRAA